MNRRLTNLLKRCSFILVVAITISCGSSVDQNQQLGFPPSFSGATSDLTHAMRHALSFQVSTANLNWTFEMTGLNYQSDPQRRHEWLLLQSSDLNNPRPQDLARACPAGSQIADTQQLQMIYRDGVFRRGPQPAIVVWSLFNSYNQAMPYIFDTTSARQMQAPVRRDRLQGRHPVLCLRQLRDLGSDAPPAAHEAEVYWRVIVSYSGAIGYVIEEDINRLPAGVRAERPLFRLWRANTQRGDAYVYACLHGQGRDEISFLSRDSNCEGLGRRHGNFSGRAHATQVRHSVPLLRCNADPKWRMTLHASECSYGSAVPTGLYVYPPLR